MDRRQEDDLEAGTWSETAEELSKGWVWDAKRRIFRRPKFWHDDLGCNKGPKLRVIDDCRTS